MTSRHTLSIAAVAIVSALSSVACTGADATIADSTETAIVGNTYGEYTDLGPTGCRVIDENKAWSTSNCGGVGAYTFLLQQSDLRYSAAILTEEAQVDLELFDSQLSSWPAPRPAGGSQRLGPKVEWRLSNSAGPEVPHALVFRLIENGGDDQFMVVKLSQWSSCLFAIVDGRAPNANVLAREAADSAQRETRRVESRWASPPKRSKRDTG